MASSVTEPTRPRDIADTLVTTVVEQGSASHPYIGARTLLAGLGATRNLADAVHYLCLLHGRFPGVIDLAAERAEGAARERLIAAADGFSAERAWLTRLVVAAGPLPSTPGQAESETAVMGQYHALETLARSDRTGCALGAALALLLDWRSIHRVFDVAADRFGLAPAPLPIPEEAEIRAIAGAVAITPAIERALGFGAQQLVLQHRGMWDLLEAREAARRDI